MCRHYGFRANERTKVECTLVHAQNALLSQSRGDLRGKTHTDGWGIAVYNKEHPEVEKRAKAAFDDVHFNMIASQLYAKTVIAHVRKSTIGGPSLANTHPFVYSCWSMCHNGTVTGFAKLREQMIRETAPQFRARRLGTTDSEQLFYWLLTRMEESSISAETPCHSESKLGDVISESLLEIVQRCERVSPNPPKLNLILTDGNVLLATRWLHTLYWSYHYGLDKCEYCGVPHVEHRPGIDYRAIVVASEPISVHDWQELPDGTMLTVGPDIQPVVTHIGPEPAREETNSERASSVCTKDHC